MIELKNQIFAITVFLIILVVSFSGCLEGPSDKPQGRTFYVDVSGGKEYTSIQEAINNASDGDNILVSNGDYFENIHVDKSLKLKGSEGTILHPENVSENKNSIVYISSDNCTLQGFTIRNIKFYDDVIGVLINSSGNKITRNKITWFEYGIYLKDDPGQDRIYKKINISNNEVSNCTYGIYVRADSEENIIYNNEIYDNLEGINLYYFVNNSIIGNNVHSNTVYGIYINIKSDGNIVTRNVCSENRYGIRFKSVSYNEIFLNRLEKNELGLYACCGSNSNLIYKNTCIENIKHASDGYDNSWDDGTTGNYWDNYTSVYPNAKKQGIFWDTPYSIPDGDNLDRHPLVNPTI